jgi:hypothetical protein
MVKAPFEAWMPCVLAEKEFQQNRAFVVGGAQTVDNMVAAAVDREWRRWHPWSSMPEYERANQMGKAYGRQSEKIPITQS